MLCPLYSTTFSIVQMVGYVAFCSLLRRVRASSWWQQPQGFDRWKQIHNLVSLLLSVVCAVGLTIGAFLNGQFANARAFWFAPLDFQQLSVYSLSYTLFTLSKVYEWIDTAFLILSGKPVIWLHYLHHLTTFSLAASMVSCDHRGDVGVDLVSGAALWPSLLNSLVHIVMYAYYYQPDKYRKWRHWITTIQIIQFLLVFVQSPIVLWYTFNEMAGSFLLSHLYAAFCYSLYLVLFLNFCHKQYAAPATTKRT